MLRIANESDVDVLATLNREVQLIHSGSYPSIFKPYSKKSSELFFRNLLASKKIFVFLALSELLGPCGYIAFEQRKSRETELTRSYKSLYIHHIAISEKCKRTGIGRLLLNHALGYAKKNRIKRVELDVWSFNQKAKIFFKKQGFKVFNEKMTIVF